MTIRSSPGAAAADRDRFALLDPTPARCAECERQRTARLRAEREVAEEKKKLRAISSELALVEERERRRIAAGLHDHVGQILGVAKVELGQALATVADPGAGAAVAEARRLVDRAIREIRSLTFELSSPVLAELGFGPALQGLAERAQDRHGLAFSFAADAPPEPVAEEAAVQLYSIVRELLWNVVKHARARRGTLDLACDDHRLRITVSDDGVGFDATGAGESLTPGGGLGLFSARQRLEHLGGDLEIDSGPGEGTRALRMRSSPTSNHHPRRSWSRVSARAPFTPGHSTARSTICSLTPAASRYLSRATWASSSSLAFRLTCYVARNRLTQ